MEVTVCIDLLGLCDKTFITCPILNGNRDRLKP